MPEEVEQPVVQVPVRSEDRGAGRFMAGILVGALFGGAVALLFAPSSGDATRRRLRRRLRKLREAAGEEVGELKAVAREARRRLG